MAKSNTKGKAEKAKKVGSKSKTKPKSAAKPKAVKKIKKAATKSKPVAKKPVKASKVLAKKTSSPKKAIVKAKSTTPVKKVPIAKSVLKKTPSKPVTSLTTKGIKAEKTKVNENTNLKDKKIVSTKVVNKNTGNFELGVVLRTGRRPEAIIVKKNIENNNMGEEKLRYSEEELKEFEVLILEKLDKAKKELNYMKEMLSKKNDEGTDNTGGTMKLLEDGADTLEKENFSQLAVRQQKFVTQLENAVARIKNGTYGVCIDTGKLIPKERLKAVPHTQHSIEAKLNRR
jgi:DnaK suppressor protein